MKFKAIFVENDLAEAKREYYCCIGLLEVIKEKLERGDFYEAEQRIMDLTNSNHQLKRLQGNKRNHSTRNLVNMLQRKGETNEVLRQFMQEG